MRAGTRQYECALELFGFDRERACIVVDDQSRIAAKLEAVEWHPRTDGPVPGDVDVCGSKVETDPVVVDRHVTGVAEAA